MMKILVVDDIKEDLYMLETLLRGYGYEVKSATDGVEALEKASQEDFDIIISDILMPRMDGFQLCREIKKNEKFKKIAFVFYTATYTDPNNEEFALSLGAERFIVKPTEPDDFIEILREVIKSHEMGILVAPRVPIEDETIYLKEYNEQLIKKLEDKMLELERVNKGLRESEEKYRNLIDNANDAVIVFERTGYISFVNPKFCEMTGYSIDEAKKLHFNKLIHLDDLDMVTEYFRKRLAGEKVPRNYEVRLLTKAGKTIYIDNNASTIEKEDRIVGVLSIMRDITERKRAEEALQESERRYRLLAENVTDVIWTTDMNLRLTYISPSVMRLRGYSVEEAMSQTPEEILTPASLEVATKVFTEELAIENMEQKDLLRSRTLELEQTCKDGSTVWVEVKTTFLRDPDGRPVGILGVTRDITEHKRAEEEKEKIQAQLLQAQKMESIGTLAGCVAHDFNNLLTAIHGYTELAMMKLDEDEPIYRDLKEVQRASVRATNLTRQLLLFSRRQPMEMTPLDLNKTIEDMMKMVRRLIGEDITVTISMEEGLRTIKADPGNIEQVIMNLMVNARDAMPEGGEIAIRTENVHLDEDDCKAIIDARPGNFVRLSIADTGIGMNKETIERIFEPFFSTKGPGKGTGLGLSVVYGIIKQHEGWINVYSEPGQGATFRIYLPAVSVKPDTVDEQPVSLAEFQGSGERILLVEDDVAIRELNTKILRQNGYIPFSAASAEEALEVFKRENGDFALVFSDIVLPDKGGLQLIDELLSNKPDLRVVLSSGYSDEKSQWEAIRESGFRFLQKPYSLPDFLRVIREVLEIG